MLERETGYHSARPELFKRSTRANDARVDHSSEIDVRYDSLLMVAVVPSNFVI